MPITTHLKTILKAKFIILLSICLFLSTELSAQFNTGQAADVVLGQPSLTENIADTSATKMYEPYGHALNRKSGKLYVADGSNNRILRFPSALTSGMPAEEVLGQADFTSSSSGTSAGKFSFPSGIHVDNSGNLWVADFSNHRVLMFEDVDSLSKNANAKLVLGQADFTSSGTGSPTQSNFANGLEGIFVDKNGRLWVADYGNRRVLWFNNAANLANGAPADGVLGQVNFTSNSSATSASLMAGPAGIFVDDADRLWVTDYSNHRVLRFDNASNLPATGAVASAVLGQPDFTSSTGGPTQSLMRGPNRLHIDSLGTLWVIEYSSHRLLGYYSAASKANGAPADIVIGQKNFTDGDLGTDADSLNYPVEVNSDLQGRLLVSDYYNNRVLRFSHPAAQPDAFVSNKKDVAGKNRTNATGKRQKLLVNMPVGTKKLQVVFRVKNKSNLNPDAFLLTASDFSKKAFRVQYFHQGNNITAEVVAGTYLLKNINPGVVERIIARISTKSSSSKINRKIRFSAASTIDESLVDVVRAHIVREAN